MTWQQFDYNDYKCGLFWVLTESPDYDVGSDDEGTPVGVPTGEIVRKAVLVNIEDDHEGHPCFYPVDSLNFGLVSDDSHVSHFAEVTAPAILLAKDIQACKELAQWWRTGVLNQHGELVRQAKSDPRADGDTRIAEKALLERVVFWIANGGLDELVNNNGTAHL